MQQGSMVVVSHDDRAKPAGNAVAAGERAYRWARTGGIRLYVQSSSPLPGWSARHLDLVDEAVSAWTKGARLEIQRVSWPREADVRLYWTDRLPPTNPGVTMLYTDAAGRLSRADIFIDVQPAPWGIGTPDRVLYATIAHELGHALGLPHDPALGALMHPSPLVTAVTDIDKAQLAALLDRR